MITDVLAVIAQISSLGGLRGNTFSFTAPVCRKNFSLEDQENGYIHKKALSLKERYPDRLKERNNKGKRFRSKKKNPPEVEEMAEELEPFI